MKTKITYVKLLHLLLIFFFLTSTHSLLAQRQNLILEATFEGSNPFGSPLSLSGNQYCCSYSLTQSTDHARAGTSSMKIDLRKSDPLVSSSKRSEIETAGGSDSPTEGERWYGGSWFLPSPWQQDGFSESLLQWHDADGTTPPFAILCHDGHIWGRRNINGAATNHDLGLVTAYQGAWMDIVIHIKWTVGNTGFIQVWMNGVQKLNVSNIRTNSNGCYMKIGMNKFIWADNPGSSTTTQRIFYVDEFRVGNANATYADVAPSTATVPPSNQIPAANAGTDKTLTLPTNSTTLTGSGTDPDGTIASYAWSRVSGPTTFTLGSAGAATTTLSNLVAGTYVFRLTVTDNGGAIATDDVTVTVNAAPNLSPTANAGTDKTLTLPTNSTTLTGSGTDPDGTIASYAWTRVSGPTTFTLGSANAATTTLSNLVAGTYVFRLTVTDNGGATATDNVTVAVNAATPGNQTPTANAGNNITLTLPANSTTLTGSGTDPDGTIASYAWTRVSGPTTFTLGSANAAITTLSNLVAGTYVFRLTVTDNGGAATADDVTVTVNAATPGNQPPVARAGSDMILTLPVNSTSLSGAASTDPDGVIAGYEWTQVSGPSQITIANRLTISASVSGLVVGEYVFSLKVTDNIGASSTTTIRVTVKDKNGETIDFNLYPNPSSGTLNMKYSNNGNGKIRVSVYDATRKLVRDEIADKTQTTLTKTIDVNILENGVYILQIVLPDGRTAAKQFVRM